jgi:hypothetical protein
MHKYEILVQATLSIISCCNLCLTSFLHHLGLVQRWAWAVLCAGSGRDQLPCTASAAWRKAEMCCQARVHGSLHSTASDGWDIYGECLLFYFEVSLGNTFSTVLALCVLNCCFRNYLISLLLHWPNLWLLKVTISTSLRAGGGSLVSPSRSQWTKHRYHQEHSSSGQRGFPSTAR